MTITCLNLIKHLNKSIDNTNYELIDNMTEAKVEYKHACIKPNIAYDFFFQSLKKKWWLKK